MTIQNTDLIQRQIALEEESKFNAYGKYSDRIDYAVDTNTEDDTDYGRRLFATLFQALYVELEKEVLSPRFGNKPVVKNWLRPSYIKWTELPDYVKDNIATNPLNDQAATIATSLVNQISNEPRFTDVLNKVIRNTGNIFNLTPGQVQDYAQDFMSFYGTIISRVASTTGVFDIEQLEGRDNYLVVSDKWCKIIEDLKNQGQANSADYQPMLCKPVKHTNLYSGEGGYLNTVSPILKFPAKRLKADPDFSIPLTPEQEALCSGLKKGLRNKFLKQVEFDNKWMTMIHPSIYNFTSETNPDFFDDINEAQETAYQIRKPLLEALDTLSAQGLYFHKYNTKVGAYKNEIKKDIEDEIIKTEKARLDYALSKGSKKIDPLTKGTIRKITRDVQSKWNSYSNKARVILQQSRKFIAEDAIYYPMFADHRFRFYPYATYGVSPMSCSLGKAMLDSTEKEALTPAGVEALFEVLANALGYDKINADVKIGKAKDFYQDWKLESDISVFVKQEDEFEDAILALSVVLELQAYDNDPTFLSGFRAGADARLSGASIISTILKDLKGMGLSSVLEKYTDVSYQLPDGYISAANKGLEIAKSDDSVHSQLCVKYSDLLFTRANFKKPVMTGTSYGATSYRRRKENKDLFQSNSILSELGVETKKKFDSIMEESLKDVLPMCMAFLEVNRDVCERLGNSVGEIAFNNPITGLPFVHQEFKVIEVRAKARVSEKSVKEIILKMNTNEVDPKAIARASSPNMIHNADGTLLQMVRKKTNFAFSHVHDELISHPNHKATVRRYYAESMYELGTCNYLQNIYEQLGVNTDLVPVSKEAATDDDMKEILNSRHILV